MMASSEDRAAMMLALDTTGREIRAGKIAAVRVLAIREDGASLIIHEGADSALLDTIVHSGIAVTLERAA